MRKKWKEETGQAAVLFGLVVVVLVGTVALVIDYGRPAKTARELQNAADSAALAAATLLPANSIAAAEPARAEAQTYADKNGFTDVRADFRKVTDSGSSPYTIVDVTVRDNVEYTFAKIFGLDSIDVERSASAQLMAVSGLRGAVPLSIEKGVMDSAVASGNYHMTLKFGGGSGTNGAYGVLDLDGNKGGGAKDYKDRLINGYDGIVSVGSQVPTENGNMSGPTEKGVQARYNACTHYTSSGGCSPTRYEKGCPRIMFVPVVTYTSKHEVQVNGFAPFLISSYTGHGNECFVYGDYLPGYSTEGEADPSAPVSPYGPYTVKLVG